jgi:hypothetical protein
MQPTEKRGTDRATPRRLAGVALCFLLAAAAASFPVMADQVVYFVNGKAMTVKTIEKGPKITVLEVEGGGRIGVPTLQIDRIEDLNVSPPPATVPVTAIIQQQPAPQQTAPAQVAVATPAGQAAAGPQAPAAGPGAGGKALGNGNLPAPPALGVGSDDPGDGAARPGGLRMPGQSGMYGPGAQAGPQGAASRYNGALGNPSALQRRQRANFGRGRPGAQPGAATYYQPGAPGQGTQPPGNSGQPAAGQGNGQAAPPPPAAGASAGNGQQSAPPPQAPTPPPQAQPQPPPPNPDPGQNDQGADDAGSDDSQQQGSSDGGSNQN